MAKIQGITIELGADASGIESALKDVNKASNATTKELGQINKALKFDPDNAVLLQQKFEVLQDSISNTTTKLDALKQAQNELNARAASGENVSAEQFRALAREIEQTEGILRGFQRQYENVDVRINGEVDVSALDKMKQKLDEVSEKAQEVGGKMKDVGAEMSTNLSAPIAAMGTGALLAAGQFDNAAGQIQAALGVTAEEAEQLENVATNVWKDGFGESLEEVSSGLIRVQQNMKEIDGSEIETVTKNALALAKAFESDVNEVTRGANNLMVNFGISADEAFDMMAKGAQNGLNFSNELFDNLAEYSGLFANMGYTVEEYFGILQRGSEAGVYNLDYLNDVMKEFQIRIKDGSDAVGTAFGDMKQETQDVWDAFYYGEATVKDVATAVIDDLQSMEDQTYANFLGVSLFGTKWEDLESKAMYAMLGVEGGLTDAKGAMDALTAAQEQTFGQRWESFTRSAAASLEPLGKTLLDLAENWLPKIISAVESVANWFSNLSPTVQTLSVVFGAVVAAIGPFLVIVGSIVSAIGAIIPVVTSVVGSVGSFSGALAALTGPIGIAVAAIALIGTALVTAYTQSETFREGVNTVFGAIKDFVVDVFTNISDFVSEKITLIKDFWDENGPLIEKAFATVFGEIQKVAEDVFPAIQTVVETVISAIGSVIDLGLDAVLGFVKVFASLLTGDWENLWEGVKDILNGVLDFILDLIELVFGEEAAETIEGFVEDAIKFFSNLSTDAEKIFSGIENFTSTAFEAIKDYIIDPIQEASDTVGEILDGISGFFENLDLSIPEIKLPKLPSPKITGKFSLDPPSVPKISWNALGGVFNKPTILQSSAGLQGVGEAGSEAIIPLKPDVLAGIGKGIAEQMNGGMPSTIVVQSVLDGRIVAETITPFVSQNQQSNTSLKAMSRGVQL